MLIANLWRKLVMLPMPLRALIAKAIVSISPQTWNNWAATTKAWLPRSIQLVYGCSKFHKGASVLASPSIDALYLGLVSHWHDPAAVVINGHEPPTLLTANSPRLAHLNDTQQMMALDTLTYLPDDILVKVDRVAYSD
jgi:asparagine synthase (glutamine-hydrolysing)